ncbi:MAG: hypothetical protein MI974_18335 [Chitinophagales bacterium]|nr:hypothetical protein [Chitinophagales bacterium]
MWRSIAILIAIGVGILIPAAEQFTYIIRYSLMVMLFFAFLQVELSVKALHKHHLWVLLLNISLPLLLFFAIRTYEPQIALAVFAISITPTAAAAPVMASFLKKQVAFVTVSVLVTSPIIALALPFILPWILESTSEGVNAWAVAGPVMGLIFIPLLSSQLLKKITPSTALALHKYAGISFILFLINVFIAAAKATSFLMSQNGDALQLIAFIAIVIGMICILQFKIGEQLGANYLPIETGLALGRKNTMFGIWLALTFIHPLAALGPMFYILYQNVYNARQLYQLGKEENS